jgi:N-acetylneuraminic acid mutarotase
MARCLRSFLFSVIVFLCTLSLSWSGLAGTDHGYVVDLYNAQGSPESLTESHGTDHGYLVDPYNAGGAPIWSRYGLTSTSLAYDGVPLAEGRYSYDVHARDTQGNFSQITTHSTYDPEILSPPWVTKASMAAARSQTVGDAIDGILYLAGGWDGQDTPTLQAYNPAANAWTALTSMPGGRYGSSGACAIDGRLYVPGGWTTNPGLPNGNLYVYDPQTNAWTEKAPLPDSRLTACGAAGVINGKMYMTTACNGYSGYRNFLDVYDPATNSWASLAASQVAHGYPAWGVIDNKLYVAGGHTDNGNMGNTLEVYDPATNTWTTKAPLPVAGVGFASGAVNGKLYVTGGTDGQGHILSDLYIYDPALNTWTKEEASPLSTPRVHAAAGGVNGTFYIAGGQNPAISPSPLDVVEAYTPPAADSGLVAYYPFNGNANDESGNGYHGVVHGDAVLTADRFGNADRAYLFGATDAYIVVPNSRNLKFNNFSLLAWIRILTDTANDEMLIVGQHVCGYGNGYFLGLYYGHKIRFYPYFETSESYEDNKWHLLAAVADGTQMHLYVDGFLVHSVNGSVGGGDQYDADLTIGRFFNLGTSFQGAIDDVRLFNRALSPVEIQSLYGEGGWQGEQANYNLSAIISGTGSGSVTTDKGFLTWTGATGTASYEDGVSVTLTAFPEADGMFGGWTGCDGVSGNQCTVTMNADRTVSVVFNDRYAIVATRVIFPAIIRWR